MRLMIFLPLFMTVLMIPGLADASLPGALLPATDPLTADVSVRMTVRSDCNVRDAAIVQSKNPEWNDAVVKTLSHWCFHPQANPDGKFVDSTGVRYFVFATTPPDAAPVLEHALGTLSIARGEPLPGGEEEDRAVFIEDQPVEYARKNDIWMQAPEKHRELASMPPIPLDLVVSADGEVVALLPPPEAPAEFSRALGDIYAALMGNHAPFKPAERGGQPVPALARTRVGFYLSVGYRKLQLPEFPRDMLGLDGTVKISYVVETDGTVHDIKVLGASHPKFEDSVIDAFAKAHIAPAQRLGAPVAMRALLLYRYVTRGGGRQPFQFSGGVSNPKMPPGLRYDTSPQVKTAVDPVYPFELARQGYAGSAEVDVLITPDGMVRDVRIAEASKPEFGLSLKAAMEEWAFEPARKDGKPTGALFKREHKFEISAFAANGLSSDARRILRELDHASPDLVDGSALDAPLSPLYQAQPAYPAKQLMDAIGDVVTIEFFVDRDGHVQFPHAVTFQDASLAWAAATAVSRWRFEPPLRDGKPVDVRALVKLRFDPPPPDGDKSSSP